MRSRAVAVVVLGALIAAEACSKGASGGPASSCPSAVLPDCPIAAGATDCSPFDLVCGLDSLPTGMPCSAPAQCSIPIDPCPDWQQHEGSERVDGYVCSCVDGRWSCDDCWEGASLCAEAPDGAPLVPAFEDAATDSPSSASADAQVPAQCEWGEGDVAEVTVAFTGSELRAGPGDAIVEWFDDAGMRQSCGPSSCDARCPPGTACSAAFITHALVHGDGTCR
jgi:hypothetical protein